MVDSLERALKLVLHRPSRDLSDIREVRVFVVGDGVQPLCAACLALHLPNTWTIYSIDPLLEPVALGGNSEEYSNRFIQFKGLSQDFRIPICGIHNSNCGSIDSIERCSISSLSIIIACHSHAPLLEFWDRIPPCKSSNSHLYRSSAQLSSFPSSSSHQTFRADSVKLAVAMPCCANYSDLDIKPIFEFDDFEVYSSKRRIKIYSSPADGIL